MIKIKKLSATAIIPKYIREGDAAMDLYADETKILAPNTRTIVKTGIAMAIPQGHVGLIWDRSGMAIKQGIKSMGGVIDANYRGEIGVILHNLSQETLTIEPGMRIAQMIIQEVHQKQLIEVKELDETVRGENAFGSTGLK